MACKGTFMNKLHHTVLFGSAAAAMLAACSSPQSAVNPSTANYTVPSSHVDAENMCPLKQCIIVPNAVARGNNSGVGSLVFLARGAHGNARPVNVIVGSKTKLDQPIGVTVDGAGDVYAANNRTNSITVYAPGATGNASPARTIAGQKTELLAPTGIVLDSAGELLVANADGVTVYAANANGDVRPVRQIDGQKTGINHAAGIALDSNANIYVSQGTSIAVFAANAKGNVAPKRFITGSLTHLGNAQGIAVDKDGYVYVADNQLADVDVFAPGADGNQAPVRQDSDGLYSPDGVSLDPSGKIYVSDGCSDNPNYVLVYPAGSNGAQPLRQIQGHRTHLYCVTNLTVR
jgi:sugar lactone lactonase YvrE